MPAQPIGSLRCRRADSCQPTQCQERAACFRGPSCKTLSTCESMFRKNIRLLSSLSHPWQQACIYCMPSGQTEIDSAVYSAEQTLRAEQARLFGFGDGHACPRLTAGTRAFWVCVSEGARLAPKCRRWGQFALDVVAAACVGTQVLRTPRAVATAGAVDVARRPQCCGGRCGTQVGARNDRACEQKRACRCLGGCVPTRLRRGKSACRGYGLEMHRWVGRGSV